MPGSVAHSFTSSSPDLMLRSADFNLPRTSSKHTLALNTVFVSYCVRALLAYSSQRQSCAASCQKSLKVAAVQLCHLLTEVYSAMMLEFVIATNNALMTLKETPCKPSSTQGMREFGFIQRFSRRSLEECTIHTNRTSRPDFAIHNLDVPPWLRDFARA
jgi:hypothetical protein